MSSLQKAVAHSHTIAGTKPEKKVSVVGLLRHHRPTPSTSTRALLPILQGLKPTTRWAVVIVTLTNRPRVTTLPSRWFHRLFSDGAGVASYFRQMSGSREIFSWDVFGPLNLYTGRTKARLVAEGAAAEGAYLHAAAAKAGVPVSDFDRFLWVMDLWVMGQRTSGGTASGGHIFVAAANTDEDGGTVGVGLTSQMVCHEIGHDFGVVFEGDIYTDGMIQTYGDPFCVMDNGPNARSFQNNRFDHPADGNNHRTTGPVMCAPHLSVIGWLSSVNVHTLPLSPSSVNVVIFANAGAPPHADPRQIAVVLRSERQELQYWLEYRHPSGFDRWLDRPVSTSTVDLPQGALVLHERRLKDNHVILVDWVHAAPGNSLEIADSGLAVDIVAAARLPVSLELRVRKLNAP